VVAPFMPDPEKLTAVLQESLKQSEGGKKKKRAGKSTRKAA